VLATATLVGNRYVLGPVIGRGGGADVFRADDTETGQTVAVKVLRSATPEDLGRFSLEAKTLSRLDHPAIVRMCDQGEHDGVPYLVLDFIDGEPLSAVLQRGPLSEDEVTRIGGVLAGALAHAHEAGVVHRDVKPGNVLFDARGNVHLTDFGIARLTDVTAITAHGMVIGTAAYLSPEQLNGTGATSASDVYALGLVLIEALTGERVFTGTPSEAAVARLHRDPEVPETASPSLRLLLLAMTARDPADRPTASAVAASLDGESTTVLPIIDDATTVIAVEPEPDTATGPVAETDDAAPMVLRAPAKRHGLAPLLIAAVVLALLVYGWSTSGNLPGAASTPASTVPSTTAPPPTTAAPVVTTAPPAQQAPAPKDRKKKGH
jgi:serine/threonine protein kinase